MDSMTSPISSFKLDAQSHIGTTFNDSSILNKQTDIRGRFVWPKEELVSVSAQELNEPSVDLEGFFF